MSVSIAGDGTLTGVDAALSGFGKILQVVSTTKTDTFTTSSTSFTDVTGLTATITPSSASNKVLVIASVMVGVYNSSGYGAYLRLSRGGTGIAVGDADGNKRQAGSGIDGTRARYSPANFALMTLDSPATTSSTTYAVQASVNNIASGAIFINRALAEGDNDGYVRVSSTITAIEVAA